MLSFLIIQYCNLSAGFVSWHHIEYCRYTPTVYALCTLWSDILYAHTNSTHKHPMTQHPWASCDCSQTYFSISIISKKQRETGSNVTSETGQICNEGVTPHLLGSSQPGDTSVHDMPDSFSFGSCQWCSHFSRHTGSCADLQKDKTCHQFNGEPYLQLDVEQQWYFLGEVKQTAGEKKQWRGR